MWSKLKHYLFTFLQTISWISETTLLSVSLFSLKIVQYGKIPKHIAFIMDGNRRYARKMNIERLKGHTKGFDTMTEICRWCLNIGIKEVTVYAFSVGNYKRSKEEVEELMNLARRKFKRILKEGKKLKEFGLKIRFIGNKSLLPDDVAKIINEVENLTRENNKIKLNIAFSYSAQDEMTYATNIALKGLVAGHFEKEDLNVNLFSNCLYTANSPPPELIVRTSGETRLSDFLLWQGSCSYLHFTGVLWPEFSACDFFWAVFNYQRVCETLEKVGSNLQPNESLPQKAKEFISSLRLKPFEKNFSIMKTVRNNK